MNYREIIEERENEMLCEFAAFTKNSKGRECPVEECSLRTCYMRDRDKIIHSKSFRRLKHKTQAFISPEGDHYRTRLTHTLEVAQISRTIARVLRLNEDLTEAIALGHDLGHTPFGHAGETALNDVMSVGFSHNAHSLRVVEILENDGRGLNLTYEVRDGIICHTGDKMADTLCGRIVHYADRIAYINHDIDDSIRAGVLENSDIPREISEVLGKKHSERIDSLVHSIANYSDGKNLIGMDIEHEIAMKKLRNFMFERVYKNPLAKGEEGKCIDILKQLFAYFMKYTDKLPEDFKHQLTHDSAEIAVSDYIAGMTDRYAVSVFEDIFIPKSWGKL